MENKQFIQRLSEAIEKTKEWKDVEKTTKTLAQAAGAGIGAKAGADIVGNGGELVGRIYQKAKSKWDKRYEPIRQQRAKELDKARQAVNKKDLKGAVKALKDAAHSKNLKKATRLNAKFHKNTAQLKRAGRILGGKYGKIAGAALGAIGGAKIATKLHHHLSKIKSD